MTTAEIKERIRSRLGIDKLNDMQQAMAGLAHPRRLRLAAPTGAGKTLAFAIPLLASMPAKEGATGPCAPAGAVIAPTRELVLQIFEVIRKLAAPDFKTCAIYGGHSTMAEKASLDAGVDIVVATPGRLLDHVHRGNVDLGRVRSLVLDEYDKSLELGFHKEMKALVGKMGRVDTLILTSATSSDALPDFIDARGIKDFDFRTEAAPAPQLTVRRVHSAAPDKLDTLIDVLRHGCPGRTIVFVNHREAAERVAAGLGKAGIAAGLYHGALEQDMRQRALILFGSGTTPVLVATDLAARGLDIPEVGTVVHYHLPLTAEAWTHRNGRTGRQGTEGNVLIITSDKDSLPDFIGQPETAALSGETPERPAIATLYFNAGSRDKISRGDIAGFILRNTDLTAERLGRIDLTDHSAYAAVPADRAAAIAAALKPLKLKGRRVRVSVI